MTRRVLLATWLMVALIGCCSSSAFAQDGSKRTAVIPFTFVLEGTSLPAGTYEVQMMDSGSIVLLNTKQAAVEGEAATLPLPMRNSAARSELIFVASATGYTLFEIHIDQTRALITSEYGHPKFTADQVRSVPITSNVNQSAATASPASGQATQRP